MIQKRAFEPTLSEWDRKKSDFRPAKSHHFQANSRYFGQIRTLLRKPRNRDLCCWDLADRISSFFSYGNYERIYLLVSQRMDVELLPFFQSGRRDGRYRTSS